MNIVLVIILFSFIVIKGSALDKEITYDKTEKIQFEIPDKENLRGRKNTWVGIGFGKGMQNTDMNVLEIYSGDKGTDSADKKIEETSNSIFRLFDMYSYEFTPFNDEDIGGKYNIFNIQIEENKEDYIIISYIRPLNTGDKYDKLLKFDIVYDLIVAWGNKKLSYHKSQYFNARFLLNSTDYTAGIDTSGGLDLLVGKLKIFQKEDEEINQKNAQENEWSTDNNKEFTYTQVHVSSLFVFWWGLNSCGYLVIRLYRNDHNTVMLHSFISAMIGMLSITILVLDRSTDDIFSLTHIYIGKLFFVMLLVQLLLGIIFTINNQMRVFINIYIYNKLRIFHKVIYIYNIQYLGICITYSSYIAMLSGSVWYYDCVLYIALFIHFSNIQTTVVLSGLSIIVFVDCGIINNKYKQQ